MVITWGQKIILSLESFRQCGNAKAMQQKAILYVKRWLTRYKMPCAWPVHMGPSLPTAILVHDSTVKGTAKQKEFWS